MNDMFCRVLVCILIVIVTALALLVSKLYPVVDAFEEDKDMLDIKIKYCRDIKPLDVFEEGDWIDLRSGIDVTLEPGASCIIPLGVCMELPEGYSAIIAPRSSTFKKWGIMQTNGIGIIDHSYCGDNDEWGLPVIAFRKTTIHKNDRICQFRLIPQGEEMFFHKVSELGNPDRKGFGSTGDL